MSADTAREAPSSPTANSSSPDSSCTVSAPADSTDKKPAENPPDVIRTAPKVWRDTLIIADSKSQWPDDPRVDRCLVVSGRSLRGTYAKVNLPSNWHVPAAEPSKTSPLIVDWADDVTEAETVWLWPGRIPFGRLTLLAGDESRAASCVAMDLAARLSRAAPWPGEAGNSQEIRDAGDASHITAVRQEPRPPRPPRPPDDREFCDEQQGGDVRGLQSAGARVLYLAPHRERVTHCVPGLRRAGADLASILCVDGVCSLTERKANRGWRRLELPDDISSLRMAINGLPRVQLVVLDPFEAFCGAGGNSRSRANAADLLRELAWDFGVAVLAVTRLKSTSGARRTVPEIENPALATLAASAWGVVRTGRQERHHLLLPIHCTVAEPGPALTFDLGSNDPGPIEWSSQSFDMTAADFADDRNTGVKFAIAAAWLKGLLAKGARSTGEIKREARKLGLSPNMLRNLRAELKVKSRKAGFQGNYTWELPAGAKAQREVQIPIGESSTTDFADPEEQGEGTVSREPLKIGENPSTLADSSGISNVEGGGVPPQD